MTSASAPPRVESFADPVHPTVVCTINGPASNLKFISASEIGYTTADSADDPIDGQTTVHRMRLATGSQPVNVTAFQGAAMDVAWSPDGKSVAWLAYTNAPDLGSGNANQLWLKIGDSSARALTPLIPLFGRDGSIDDQISVRFSPDGKYVLMVDTYVAGAAPASADVAMMQVRSATDGTLVWVPPSALDGTGSKGGPFLSMATWSHSGDRVFYRDTSGVHVWDPSGNLVTLASGLSWSWPSLAPDDSLVAYTVNIATAPSIQVRDLGSSVVSTVAGLRGYPILLSDTTMLEARLVRNTGMGPPYLPDKWLVLNLATRTETELADVTPSEVWAASV